MPDDAPQVASQGYLTPERIMMRDVARQFVRDEVLPAANRLDPVKGDIPRELIDKMGELGFFGILIPEELGGLGLGAFEYCLVAEELARGWMSVASIIARGNSFYRSIPGEGEDWRRKVALMAKGQYLGAAALSEPGVGSDLASVTCRARREGDEWVHHRQQVLVHLRRRRRLHQRALPHRRSGAPAGRGGTISVSVEKPKGELPAGCTGSPIPKIGYFGWKTWELRFDGARAGRAPRCERPRGGGRQRPPQRRLRAGAGPRPHRRPLDRPGAAARWRTPSPTPRSACSSASRSATSRPSASRSRRMATEVEAARQLMYYVCSEIDAGRAGRVETSMVKLFASEMAERVTSEALQIFGGAGYTTLHPIERYWRDARLTKIFEGTSEIQQRIIADALLGKPTIRGSN